MSVGPQRAVFKGFKVQGSFKGFVGVDIRQVWR